MSPVCASCGSENPAGARFCASCGAQLSAACPRCAAPAAPGARFCAACGQPLDTATPDRQERKVATAVFIDLVDSTALAERLDPERLRAVLQSYFSLASSTIAAWGGSVEKYIGDAVVAVFGVPRIREDDAARAVSAAHEIVGRSADLTADLERRHGIRLALRIGVNTGEVIAPTEVRPDQPMVTGEAITIAARLQTAADPGGVLVGDRTFRATRHLFRYRDPVDLAVKGRQQPVRAHCLEGRLASVDAGPTRNLLARIVGRERELATLSALVDEATESRMPRLAVVYGPAGIGKSRVVREAVTLATAERPDIGVLRGRCPAVGQGITYWPLAEIVRDACAISIDDPGPVAADKLRRHVEALFGVADGPSEDANGTIDALAVTAGIWLPGNPLDQARPATVMTELARRWPQYLSALAARRPVIATIEDLHWASDQVVEMLERLLARCTGPIVLIATARPTFAEAHPSFAAGRSEATTISIRPLSRLHGASLLAALMPDGAVADDVRERVLDAAEGNALFLEEIVRRLQDGGGLEGSAGESANDGLEIAIPDTIQGLLAARIDDLPEVERRVLREAAVIGRVFWEAPITVAVGGDVTDALSGLERRGLVSMRPTTSLRGQIEYLFKHALIRDVAYGGLPVARRARAHAAVGQWLVELGRDHPEELAELVAFHYRSALDEGSDLAWPADSGERDIIRGQARLAFIAAGAGARKRFAIDAAIALHRRAVDLSETDDERAAGLEELGDDHDAAYDGDRSVPTWDQAIALRRATGDRRAVARMCMKVARAGAIRWGGFTVPMEPDVIDRYVRDGLASEADPETRAWLLDMKAAVGMRWVAFHRPDPVPLAERVAAAEEARRYAAATGLSSLHANALREASAISIASGAVGQGIELNRAALELIPRIGDPRERHLLTIEVAQTLQWIGGDAEAMVQVLRDALVLGRELRVHDHCHATGTLLAALYLSGRWDDIPTLIDEHLATFGADEAGTTCPFALGGFQLGAVVRAERGDDAGARELAAAMPRSEAPIGMVEGLQAMAANALGDPAAGRDIAARVIASGIRNFAEEPPVELIAMLDALVGLEDWDTLREFLPVVRSRAAEIAVAAPMADRAEGLAAAAAGDLDRAGALLGRALDELDPLSAFEAARTREALASILPSDAAMPLRAAALAAYDRLGAKPSAARIRVLIGEG